VLIRGKCLFLIPALTHPALKEIVGKSELRIP